MKFNDKNRDKIMDNGETGLQGWTIHLEDQNGHVIATTVTDVNGNYSFPNLAPGTYKVREVHQTGWKRQTQNPEDYCDYCSGSTVTNVLFGKRSNKERRRKMILTKMTIVMIRMENTMAMVAKVITKLTGTIKITNRTTATKSRT